MAHKPNGREQPTAGPWLVRGEAEPGAAPQARMLGIEPVAHTQPGGWPYLIRQDRSFEPGTCPPHLASGIQRLPDAVLMAAAPDLAAALLALLLAPDLMRNGLDPVTRARIGTSWDLLARVAPHLEIA